MDQAGLRIETRRVDEARDVPVNIARDLRRRIEVGKALVIAERPVITLSLIRKRWAQFVRELEVDKARTLNKWRREELSTQVLRMEWTEFTATRLDRFADVYIVEPSDAAPLVNKAATIYVAMPLGESELNKLLHKREPDTLVIGYELR